MALFNRIQNPELQDKLHSFLGIKGAGSSAPTLGGEVHPVVVLGDLQAEDPAGRNAKHVALSLFYQVTAGSEFAQVHLFASQPETQLRVQRFTVVAGSTGIRWRLESDDRPLTGFTPVDGSYTHRRSLDLSPGSAYAGFQQFAANPADVGVGLFQFSLGANVPFTFFFDDMVLTPGSGVSVKNVSGVTAGQPIGVNVEIIVEPFRP